MRSSSTRGASAELFRSFLARFAILGGALLFIAACTPSSPAVAPAAPSVSVPAAQPVQWLTRLEMPGGADCYAVKIDYMRLLTSLECARLGAVDYVRLELDPTSSSSTVGVRSLVLPLSSVGGHEGSGAAPPAGLSLVVFRKPGNMRASVPLYLADVSPGRVLSHVVVPPPLESGEATGSGVVVPVEVVGGVPTPPGSIAVAPLPGSGGYESVQCNVGSGTPVVLESSAGGSLVGVVSRPGSCDGSVPSLVAVVSYWAPWIVSAAVCSQSQQSFSSEGLAAAYSCEFSVF